MDTNEHTKAETSDDVGGRLERLVMRPAYKKMAILTLTPEAIRELLQLPENAVFVEQHIPFDQPGVMEIKVEGVGWDTPEGCVIQKAEAATVTRNEVGELEIDWRLPGA